jgi:hypothetical protein
LLSKKMTANASDSQPIRLPGWRLATTRPTPPNGTPSSSPMLAFSSGF